MYFVVSINELIDDKPALVAIKLVIVVEREASLFIAADYSDSVFNKSGLEFTSFANPVLKRLQF